MPTLGLIGWDLLAGTIELVAVTRVVLLPADAWTYQRRSKLAAVILALWGAVNLHPAVLPLGAAIVIWHTHHQARRYRTTPATPDVPYADGTPTDTANHQP